MNKQWQTRMLQLLHRTTDEEEDEYITLIWEVYSNVDYETARVLLKTYSDNLGPYYQINDDVYSVLTSADWEVLIHALLDELPRLLRDAPRWAKFLVAGEINANADLFIEKATQCDRSLKQEIIRIIDNESFINDCPETPRVITALSDEKE